MLPDCTVARVQVSSHTDNMIKTVLVVLTDLGPNLNDNHNYAVGTKPESFV